MQTTRRDVLSFASIGAAGAAGLALGAFAQSAAAAGSGGSVGGKGPALEGPLLDLRTGKGNQMAYARIQGDTDWGKQKYFWFKGYVNAVQPGQRAVNLVGSQGFGAIRLIQRPDGAIERLCREIILYTDLRSGEVLSEWKNTLTGEMVKPVHVDNDPFNYLIEEYFPMPPSFGGLNKAGPPPKRVPFILPWYQHGDWLEMEIHIHLAYPSAPAAGQVAARISRPGRTGLRILCAPCTGRRHAEPEADHGRLPGHLESRHAVAAVDADGPDTGFLPVQLLHGHHQQSR